MALPGQLWKQKPGPVEKGGNEEETILKETHHGEQKNWSTDGLAVS